MPFHFIHAEQLSALYPALRKKIRAERTTLEPQTPQTIIVGNLDTEAWLTRRFLADDGVLMGISYPFLESAIRSFSERLRLRLAPTGSECWFMPPQQHGNEPEPAGLAELEVILLGIISDRKNSGLLENLGYKAEDLTPAQSAALAARFAEELRECIMHIPQLLQTIAADKKSEQRGAALLWRSVYAALGATGRPFTSLDPALPAGILAEEKPEIAAGHSLHLFGMPLLSQYHLRALAAIARHLPVNLYTTDLAGYAQGDNALLAAAGQKAAQFRGMLRSICDEYKVEFTAEEAPSSKQTGLQLEIHSYPGVWRAAELLGDDFHAALSAEPELRQDDFAVALTDAQAQYAAFERACGMRQLNAFSRTRFYEAPSPLAELWQVLGEAAHSGPNRALIARYAANPIIIRTHGGDREKINLWLEALEKANGYRDDYPGVQDVFNISAAHNRLLRGVLIDRSTAPDTELPAARALRLFDTPAFSEAFRHFLNPLVTARALLAGKKGDELANAMLQLQHEITPPGPEITQLTRWLTNLRGVAGFETLSLAQIVRLLLRHLPATGLAQQTAREGVTFAPLHATCFVKKTQVIFDLSEDADRRDDSAEYLFSELKTAPTRLSAREQLALQLATALASEAERLVFACTGLDPVSGGEKYPSQLLAFAEAAAAACGRKYSAVSGFPVTLLAAPEKNPPVASDADRRTAWLLRRGTDTGKKLSSFLLPAQLPAETRLFTELKDLRSFLSNPARYRLQRYLPPEIELPAFRREEPRLAVGSTARLAFCEDYLKAAVLNASGLAPLDALAYIADRQRRGEAPPQGFDHAAEILNQSDNNALLTTLALSLQRDIELVEFCFRTTVGKTFTVSDAPRLTRYYLRAPQISGLAITGNSGLMLRQKSSGEILLLQSAIYPDRNADLVWSHLLLCLLAVCGLRLTEQSLSLADFNTRTSSKDPVAALKLTIRDAMQQPAAHEAQAYLELLIAEMQKSEIAWYDHALLKKENLGQWAERSDDELLGKMLETDEDRQDAKFLQLQRYFALEPDNRTVAFFNAFIRPVAIIDQEINGKENKKKTVKPKTGSRGGKNGKS